MPDQPAARPRDTRILVLWATAIALLLLAAVVGMGILAPVLEVRRVLSAMSAEEDADYGGQVNALGGEAAAARKLAIYLRMPNRFAPDKRTAVSVLATTGEAGIPAMVRNIDHPSVEVSSAVLWAMCKGHPSARQAVPQLIAASQGPIDNSAFSAIIALGKVGPDAAEAVPVLIHLLQHSGAAHRRYAARSPGQIGDRRAVEPLKATLADPDAEVKFLAAEALGLLDGQKSTAEPVGDGRDR